MLSKPSSIMHSLSHVVLCFLALAAKDSQAVPRSTGPTTEILQRAAAGDHPLSLLELLEDQAMIAAGGGDQGRIFLKGSSGRISLPHTTPSIVRPLVEDEGPSSSTSGRMMSSSFGGEWGFEDDDEDALFSALQVVSQPRDPPALFSTLQEEVTLLQSGEERKTQDKDPCPPGFIFHPGGLVGTLSQTSNNSTGIRRSWAFAEDCLRHGGNAVELAAPSASNETGGGWRCLSSATPAAGAGDSGGRYACISAGLCCHKVKRFPG